jgi:CoA:oxalate CoA-transferase
VLDLSRAISGPYAGRALADLGADVVKVEWQTGDISNVFGRKIAGVSGLFTQMNAGKRGIGVDYRQPSGIQVVRDLATCADVVIENFRPGVLDHLGLGYETLAALNRRLIMLSISGFGMSGPESHRRAYAPIIHAESGLLSRQAMFDEAAVSDVCIALADTLAALHGSVALLAALVLRDRTGNGQHIDLSMLEAMIASDDYTHNAIDGITRPYLARGEIWDIPGGPLVVAADLKTIWARLSRLADIPDPAAPESDVSNKATTRRTALTEWARAAPTRESVTEALDKADIAWADVREASAVLESPSLRERKAITYVDDHAGSKRGVVRLPYRFSDAECGVTNAAPLRGEHNREVMMDWLDRAPDETAALERMGALQAPERAGTHVRQQPLTTDPTGDAT